MKNDKTSKFALERAYRWFQSGTRGIEDKRWDDAVYSFQMATEQALKSILILFGVEYPRKHDVSRIYNDLKSMEIPQWFKNKIDDHVKISRSLINLRGKAAYGYIEGLTKDFFKNNAIKYKDLVFSILEDCKRLLEALIK
ncbi:MAG: HEPN domain-containing protein [Promethearchaeota archaeon]